MSAEKPEMQDAYYNEEIGSLLSLEVAKFTGLDGGKSEPRKPEAGDVWLHEETGEPIVVYEHTEACQYGSSTIAESVFLFRRAGVEAGVQCSVPVSGLKEKGRFLGFNIFDLLAGDPFAWAAALSFAPEVFLLEVGEGEEKHEVIGLPKGFSADHIGIHRDGKPCGEADLWWAKSDQMWHPQQVECSGASPEFVQAVATAVNAALKGDENAG